MSAVLQAATVREFFKGEVPSWLPDDAPEPDFDALAARTRALDPSIYPIDPLMTIIVRENRLLGVETSVLDSLTGPGKQPLFVVAGQQAGLFGGPLYTLYKALHAIRLAARLSEVAGRPVVPLFWIASDDHDMDEVSHLGLRSGDGAETIVKYVPSSYIAGMPVGEVVLDEGIVAAINTLAGTLPPGNAGERYIDIVRSSWVPGEQWTRAFARWMAQILTPYGLVLFNPRWDGVKRLMIPVMQSELLHPLASTKLVNEAADAMEAAHERKRALRRPAHTTNLFLEVEGIRHQLAFDDGMFHTGERKLTSMAVSEMLESSPECFSPGAALRPVCQDALMPVCATIAGPGERRYIGQLSEVYRFFRVSPSVIVPRASFTVIDRRTSRYAKKEGIDIRRLFATIDQIESSLANDTIPASVDNALRGLENNLDEGFRQLEAAIGVIDRSLVGTVQKDRGRMAHITEGIRKRAVRAHKSSLDLSQRRLAAASYTLMPSGGPQERWFGMDSIIPVLDETGIDTFIEMTSPGEKNHRIVNLA